MKIAVVGSREFNYKDFVFYTLRREYYQLYDGTIISGGAKGVDTWAIDVLNEVNSEFDGTELKVQIFIPDWDKYGKRAGFLRNELIINEADHVIAFWDGESKGTKHSIDLAIKTNKPIDIYIRKTIKEEKK